MTKTVFLAYIPVLHQGYLEFFSRHPEVRSLCLLDASLIMNYRPLVKDLRALTPEQIKNSLEALKVLDEVTIVSDDTIMEYKEVKIVAADEDITRQVIETYLPQSAVEYDRIFLRWDAIRTTQKNDVQPDVTISHHEVDQQIMDSLKQEAARSSDWWRQVGAALVKNNQVLLQARNLHLPQDLQHYSDGDPRANFGSGEKFELSTSIHAESQLIAEAAKQGIMTQGTEVYCTTFPCPVCAKLLAQAGVSKVFYHEGYSLLDGENVLKSAGVEIIKVE